jgi:hypothetical protein
VQSVTNVLIYGWFSVLEEIKMDKEKLIKDFNSYENLTKYLSVAKNIKAATFSQNEDGNWTLYIIELKQNML